MGVRGGRWKKALGGLLTAATALAAAPAGAAVLDLSGPACGGFVVPGSPFTITGSARNLPPGQLTGFRAVLDFGDASGFAPPARANFRLPVDGLPDAFVVGPSVGGSKVSFAAISAGAGMPVVQHMSLFEWTVTVAEGASGVLAIAPSSLSQVTSDGNLAGLGVGNGCSFDVAQGPTADAGGAREMTAGDVAFVSAAASTDNAGERNLNYLWEIVSGGGSLDFAGFQTAAFHAPADGLADSATVLRVTVTDPDTGLADSAEATVTVHPADRALATCTDADGDGFFAEGGVCGPRDCDDTNPDIFPGATVLPPGGIPLQCLTDCGTLETRGTAPWAEALLLYGGTALAVGFVRRYRRARAGI